MAKVVIDGETYEWDGSKAPMSEALWVEDVYKRRYVEWQDDLQNGSAKAMCVLACLVWKRHGRDVPLQDILDGTVDFDIGEMIQSIIESSQAEADAGPDPQIPGTE